jgi:hypothetical protein
MHNDRLLTRRSLLFQRRPGRSRTALRASLAFALRGWLLIPWSKTTRNKLKRGCIAPWSASEVAPACVTPSSLLPVIDTYVTCPRTCCYLAWTNFFFNNFWGVCFWRIVSQEVRNYYSVPYMSFEFWDSFYLSIRNVSKRPSLERIILTLFIAFYSSQNGTPNY